MVGTRRGQKGLGVRASLGGAGGMEGGHTGLRGNRMSKWTMGSWRDEAAGSSLGSARWGQGVITGGGAVMVRGGQRGWGMTGTRRGSDPARAWGWGRAGLGTCCHQGSRG